MKRLLSFFAFGAGVALLALFVYGQAQSPNDMRQTSAQAAPVAMQQSPGDWEIGELRPNGLRIKPSGRNDASAVLNPDLFVRSEVKQAYTIAQQIPATLNKLYCWCGCENRGIHRSNLGCFEDRMGVNCAVCRGTAEIAYQNIQKGVTDAGKIQAAVDMKWGPEWAKIEQQNRRG